MTLVETVVKDTNGIFHRYTPLEATVKLHGIRRADTSTFKYPIQARVKLGDELSYIQDIVPVSFLSAYWGFQLSTKDERGFDLDGPDLDESRFDQVLPTTNPTTIALGLQPRFAGQYALNFTSTNRGVTIPATSEVDKRIDFSKQFDIYIWFSPHSSQFVSGSNEPILFSKYSGSVGIEIGISNQGDNTWRPFVRYNTGTGAQQIRGTSTAITSLSANVNDGRSYFIRCWRDENDILRVSLNGEDDIERTVTGSLDVKGTPIIFGRGNVGSTDYRGWIHNIRVYSGSYLERAEADRLYVAKPAPFIMKFAGNVTNVSDKQSPKIVQCRSFGSVLVTSVLTPDLYSQADDSTLRTGNVYDERNDIREILEDMLELIDDSFELKTTEASIAFSQQSTIIGIGPFIKILEILLLSDRRLSFFITPRKTLIIERLSGIATGFIFRQGGNGSFNYNITESEEFNYDSATEVILIGHNNVTGYSGREDDNNKAIQIQAPFLTNERALSAIASDIKTVREGRTRRFEIKAPALINHIRVLQNVCIVNPIKIFDANRNPSEESVPITEITYEYPKGKTVIHTGANVLDYYNRENEISSQIQGIGSNQITFTGGSGTTPPPPVVNTPPTISITSPSTGALFSFGSTVQLQGTASDDEDGNLSSSIVWRSNRVTANLGAGSSINVSNLVSGNHTITATVTDSAGLTAMASISITIGVMPPNSVGALLASLDGLEVDLSWTDVLNATSYRVARRIGTSGAFTTIATVSNSEYTDRTLTASNAGATVQYQVFAVNSGGESSGSSIASVTLPIPPDRPNDMDVIDPSRLGLSGLIIRIEPNDDNDPIDLARSESSSGPFTFIETGITRANDDATRLRGMGWSIPSDTINVNIWDQNVESGTRYYYRAYSNNDGIQSTNYESDNMEAP